MKSYQQQKQQVMNLFDSALDLAGKHNNKDVERHLRKAAKNLAEGKMFVVVCGEFKQGKSSLMNALLNEPGLFPVDVDITTNLVSTISYGKKEKITVFLGEPGKEKAKRIQRAQIPDYVTEQRNQENVRQARMLTIEAPNEQLKDGLVLVDTPGVGGLNTEHSAIAYAFIPNADAILFVSDALAPLSVKELEFVEMIAGHCQHLIFVVTKIDAKMDYETVVENNRQKLAQVLERSGNEIPIIPVSSHAKLAYLESEDSEDLEESNFALLESQLWSLLGEQRGYIMLMPALGELGRAIVEMKEPLQAEAKTYQQHNQPEKAQMMERQFQEAKERLETLQEHNAKWRLQLSDGLRDIRTGLQQQLQKEFVQIRYQADRYLENEHLLSSPEQIGSLLEQDFHLLLSKLNQEISQQAATLYGQLEQATGLDINRLEGDLLAPVEPKALVKKEWLAPVDPRDSQIKKSNWWEKSLSATRNGYFNLQAGAIVGGLLGGLAGLIFGGVGIGMGIGLGIGLGGIAGSTTGVKEGLSQIREKEMAVARREISKLLKPYLEENRLLCTDTLEQAITKLERSMRDELTSQLKREQQRSERTLRSIKKARQLSQKQASERAKALQRPLQQLNQLQKRVEQLASAIVAQQEAATKALPVVVESPQIVIDDTPEQASATVGTDYGGWADE